MMLGDTNIEIKTKTPRETVISWILGFLVDVFGAIVGLIEKWIFAFIFKYNKILLLKYPKLFSNSLKHFKAELDEPLELLRKSPLVRTTSESIKNVSDYSCNYTGPIAVSKVWKHEFFPGIKTRGFDPTHKMLPGYQQLPQIDNELANLLFSCDSNVVEHAARSLFHSENHPQNPKVQGKWKDTTDDIPISTNLTDRFFWKTEEYYNRTAGQDMAKRYLHAWPKQEDEFSDEHFSQFYLSGVGQSFVRAVRPDEAEYGDGARFVAELEYLQVLDVKPGQGKYAGDVYFNEFGQVLHIVYLDQKVVQGDQQWEAVKRICRGSVVMALTAVDHLLGVHLHFSNSLSMAVPLLPVDHPLRRLLWPHIFNAVGVNRKAAITLSLDGGLFSRGWSVTLKGVRKAFQYSRVNNPLFRWHTPPELMELRGIPSDTKMPLYEDGLPFYEVVRKYVSSYVDLNWQNDTAVYDDFALVEFHKHLNEHLLNADLPNINTRADLVDTVATFIYYVTGYHTHAGTSHIEAVQDGVAPSAWNDSTTDLGAPPVSAMWSTFTYIGTASLTLPITGDTCSTEWKCGFAGKVKYQIPIPDDAADQPEIQAVGYPEFFKSDEEKEVNHQFVLDLLELQKNITSRNNKRFECAEGSSKAFCRPYNAFDVNFVEMSVAI